VAEEHDPAPQALGAGRSDVVLAHDLEQAGAGHARNDRHRDRAQRDRRQDQVPQRIEEQVELEREQPVDRVHVRQEVQPDAERALDALQPVHLRDAVEPEPGAEPPGGDAW
jgi:hypothetical protein